MQKSKYQASDVRSFEFLDLQGDHVVGQSKFESFNFKTIEGEPFQSQGPNEETIRKERTFESKTDFKIDGIVRDLRGLSRQEQNDFEQRIQEEVDKRLKVAYAEAHAEGLEKGREEGKLEAMKSFEATVADKVIELNNVIVQVQHQSDSVLQTNFQEIHEFIKRFTKWIILKEVNEKLYLENLLQKLILEMNARKNLNIKVGKANFAQMPEVIAAVEAKLGQLTNVRVEIVPEINHPGIILESENGLIDGSLEGVFENIDKIFEQVTAHE